MQHQIVYNEECQSWIQKELARLMESGMLEHSNKVQRAESVVLVEQG